MATQEQIKGNWNQLKGKIRERWGQISDVELQEAGGNFDQVVGLIQQKTGEARSQIEHALNDLSDQAGGVFAHAAEAARQYADQAGEAFRGAADQARERAREGYDQAYEIIRKRPTESIAVAFGTGLLLGVVVGLVAGSRD